MKGSQDSFTFLHSAEKNVDGTRRRSVAVYESKMVCTDGLPLSVRLSGPGLTKASVTALTAARAAPHGAAGAGAAAAAGS